MKQLILAFLPALGGKLSIGFTDYDWPLNPQAK